MSSEGQQAPANLTREAKSVASADLHYRADFTRNEGVPGSNPGVGFVLCCLIGNLAIIHTDSAALRAPAGGSRHS